MGERARGSSGRPRGAGGGMVLGPRCLRALVGSYGRTHGWRIWLLRAGHAPCRAGVSALARQGKLPPEQGGVSGDPRVRGVVVGWTLGGGSPCAGCPMGVHVVPLPGRGGSGGRIVRLDPSPRPRGLLL